MTISLCIKGREEMTENIIIKPSVQKRFDSFMAHGRVLFFSAPCGFGKTAVAEALRTLTSERFLWTVPHWMCWMRRRRRSWMTFRRPFSRRLMRCTDYGKVVSVKVKLQSGEATGKQEGLWKNDEVKEVQPVQNIEVQSVQIGQEPETGAQNHSEETSGENNNRILEFQRKVEQYYGLESGAVEIQS